MVAAHDAIFPARGINRFSRPIDEHPSSYIANDEGQIVELTLVICAANFTNRFNDALRAVPDLGG